MTYFEIHQEALKRTKLFHQSEKELLEILERIKDEKIFFKLGYGTLWDYLTLGLKLSSSEAGRLSSLLRVVKEVPELKAAIQSGELTVSKASRITSIITEDNASRWIEKAKTESVRTLEREIAREKPQSCHEERIIPKTESFSRLTLPISRDLERKLRRIQDILSKKKQRSTSLEECLTELAEYYLKREDPLEKPIKEKALPTWGVKNKRSVLPAWALRTVTQRDKAQCTAENPDGSRCHETRFTQIHHIHPISRGGDNHPSNLQTLCFYHHRRKH